MKDDNSIEVGGEPTPAPLSPEGKEKRHAEYQAAYRLKNGRTPESTARAHSKNQDDAFAQLPAAEQTTILSSFSSKRKHAPRRNGSLITSRQFRTPMTRISSSRSFSQRTNPITVG